MSEHYGHAYCPVCKSEQHMMMSGSEGKALCENCHNWLVGVNREYELAKEVD